MISTANLAELDSVHSGRIYFVALDFTGDAFFACTGTRSYTFGGDTYLGIGEIAGISEVVEASDAAARSITMTLSGVDAAITEPVLSRTNYKNRSAIVYRGLLDENEDLVDDPFIVWQGRMDVGSMSLGETQTAQMVSEPKAAQLLRANISRYSDQDHQERHSGDKFFEFLPQLEKKDVTWGGQRIMPFTGAGGGGPGNNKQAARQKN